LNALDFFVIITLVWLTAFLVLYLKRNELKTRGITVYPFFIMVRRDSKSEWFPSVTKTKAFKALEWAFLGLSFVSSGLGFWLLIEAIYNKYVTPAGPLEASITPIIPGITLHELMHAMSSTSNGIKVRGGGILLIYIFPGAFVEPDEQEFKKAEKVKRLKVIAAGIGLNFVLALLFLALMNYALPAMSQGAQIVGLVKDYPAYNASIPVGSVILAVNGHKITVPSQVDSVLSKTEPNNVTLLVNGSLVTKTLLTPQGKLGVYLDYYFPSPIEQGLAYFIIWMYIINFSLALINALPLFITDGAKLFSELLGPQGQKTVMYISGGTLLLLLLALRLPGT
jgi:membrane-associated protease RseP (regulator of RpoE activity)